MKLRVKSIMKLIEGQKCHEACECMGRHPYTDRHMGPPIVSKRGVKYNPVSLSHFARSLGMGSLARAPDWTDDRLSQKVLRERCWCSLKYIIWTLKVSSSSNSSRWRFARLEVSTTSLRIPGTSCGHRRPLSSTVSSSCASVFKTISCGSEHFVSLAEQRAKNTAV